MPSNTLVLNGRVVGETRLEAHDVRGAGGVGYPRLQLAVQVTFSGGPSQMPWLTVMGIAGTLSADQPPKIVGHLWPVPLNHPVATATNLGVTMEAPLDRHRISEIEKHRRGDLHLSLALTVAVAEHRDGLVSGFANIPTVLNLTIAQSQWAGHVLPALGLTDYAVVEIPLGDSTGLLRGAAQELEHAQKYFRLGDYDKTVEHCRNGLEPVKQALSELKREGSSSKYDWVETVSTATLDLHSAHLRGHFE